MQHKLQVSSSWLRKVAVCLAFFGFLSAKEVQAYGLPPLITVPPLGLSVQNGGTITLTTLVAVSLTKVTVRWYCNGTEIKTNISTATLPIVGTTSSTLKIPNATAALAGKYYVKVENGGGEVTSGDAIVLVLGDVLAAPVNILSGLCGMTNGGFHLELLKPAQSNCVVEASTDFIHWTAVYTNSTGSTNFSYLDAEAANLRQRYYRLRLQ